MDMNQTKFIDLFMLKLCNLNGWKIVMQLNYIKCKFRQNIECTEPKASYRTVQYEFVLIYISGGHRLFCLI